MSRKNVVIDIKKRNRIIINPGNGQILDGIQRGVNTNAPNPTGDLVKAREAVEIGEGDQKEGETETK